MLSLATLLRPLLLAALLAMPLPARGEHSFTAILRPEQLTVGLSDEFLGQLSPDGQTLYYLTNRNTLYEFYGQGLDAARSTRIFHERADVTWARVSPDGRHVLYISFRDEAAGQLCVRELHPPAHGHDLVESTDDSGRRCLDDGSLAVQAQWISPTEIALVSRSSLQSDLRLLRVAVGSHLTARPLLDRNLTSPAVSPNGQWLVYVPVERFINGVGPGFAARAAPHLEAMRIAGAGSPGVAQPLALDLPGNSGQPIFSADGQSLYFVQFFNDSNRDGTIDASDHGVLFRVPFDSNSDDAPARAALAFPEQLTDSSWNCQYPSPTANHLIATCAHGSNLNVYGMAPAGEVPSDWDADRLRLEIELSSKRSDLLLLYRHLLEREKDPGRRHLDLARLILLHMELEEFDAAEFYAKRLAKERDDPAIAGLGPVLLLHIAQRRDLSLRERGRGAPAFHQQSRTRLAALVPGEPPTVEGLPAADSNSAAAQALRQVVRSEISDALGDKDAARRELLMAPLEAVAVPAVLEVYYDRANALYRELDDGASLYAVGRRLSTLPQLLPVERLRYARAAVRALCRGRALDEAQALLSKELSTATPDSELHFALTLEQAIRRIRDAAPTADVQSGLVTLYREQNRPERRHAVMMDAGEWATRREAVGIVETLVELYIADVPSGTRERSRAERLYQRIIAERAYRERAAGQLSAARDDFARVARVTGSLESHVEYIELRLKEGETPAALAAEYARADAGHSDTVSRFVGAYLIALELPHIKDAKRYQALAEKADQLLRGAWHALHGEPTARVLFGALLHEEFLRTEDKVAAARADHHYLVALDLVQNNPRYRALILDQLGLLQAQARNFRIALGYLEDRERLPFPAPAARMLHFMVKAQTLAHVDRDTDAAAAADTALAICDGDATLAAYRIVVLDRAALYNLAAGNFARALALYDLELPLLDIDRSPLGDRNRLVAWLSRAAAAAGADKPERALKDLALVDDTLKNHRLSEPLKWPHTPGPESLRSYRIIAAGLRARAHRALGQLDAAAQALLVQTSLLEARQAAAPVDEGLRPLALAEGQLAELLQERGDSPGAGRWLRKALDHATTFMRNTKVQVGNDQLALLWLASELHLKSQGRLGLNFSDELGTAHERLLQGGTDSMRGYGRLFEMFIPITAKNKK